MSALMGICPALGELNQRLADLVELQKVVVRVVEPEEVEILREGLVRLMEKRRKVTENGQPE